MTDTATEHSPLRAAREAEGLSREEVTRLLKRPVSAKTLERWEKGITPVRRSYLRELAAIYKVPLSDLESA